MSRSTSRDFRQRQSRPATRTQPHVDVVVDRNAFERRDGQLADDRTIGFLERTNVDGHERASYARGPSGRKGVVGRDPGSTRGFACTAIAGGALRAQALLIRCKATKNRSKPRPEEPIALRSRIVTREVVEPITYSCPHCRAELECPPGGWDGWVRCPSCGASVSSARVRKAASRHQSRISAPH